MECKVIQCCSTIWSGKGINRNIMECKVKEAVNNVVSDGGINRNIMECKAHTRLTTPNIVPVLIETLWNVKILYPNWLKRAFMY